MSLKPRSLRAVAAAGVALALLAAAGFWWVKVRAPAGALSAAPAPPVVAQMRPGAAIVGRVELPAGVTLPPAAASAMVVVYAYALDGPRLPLAVLRRPASLLPLDFTLDDSLAPNPAFRLSQAAQLVVGARLGPGEAVAAQPGDWLAPPQTVALGTHGLKLQLQPPRP